MLLSDFVQCTAIIDSLMVGATGLEPAASCSQSKHSTKLSYAPIFTDLTYLNVEVIATVYY